MVQGRPGPAPQTAQREEFARLIARGVPSAEACRIVGVNPRTGKRWRHGRTIISSSGRRLHYPPVIHTRKAEISSRFLSEDERVMIADLHRLGQGVRAIATALHRSPSTISRELRRNGEPSGGAYRPFAAHQLAVQRRGRPGRGRLLRDPVLREFVADRLTNRWSPEQIAQALRREFPDEPDRHLVPETIYQAVYRPELGGLCRDLPAVLRTRRRRRRPHRRADARRAGALTNMRMLDRRPAEAADGGIPGHWEGDLIVGADNRSAIGTVVERASRFTMLLHLPDGRRTAEAVRNALLAGMGQLPAALRRSLAWDQGKEMALHTEVAAALDMPVFFCDPHSPWQRGTNENTNGLLRQYFPKGSDLRVYTPADLSAVSAELNSRPRKTLSWETPAQRLSSFLAVPAVSPEPPAPPTRLPGCGMADMRRRSPEPPLGPPRVEWTPGLAEDMLRELAPLLAEEGIDAHHIDVPDLATLQAAMDRAVERLNMTRFTPVGRARELAVAALRQAVEAFTDDDTEQASAVVERVQTESADDSAATVSGCIGVALGLLDDWLAGNDAGAPAGLGRRVDLPAGHWLGERAGTDILALARKGRAFRSLDTLLISQGGKNVLYGSILALAAAVVTWSADTTTPVTGILLGQVR